MRLLVRLVPILLATGCASNVPRAIQEAPAGNPTVGEVRDDIDPYQGVRVRWGGTIASVENRENETWIEVVATELGRYGRPKGSDYAFGRFIVRIEGFLDPQIYAEGRELTVAGEVESRLVRPIGEHPYTYPLVRASTYYLWPYYAGRGYHYPYYHGYYRPYGYRYHLGFGHRHHFGFTHFRYPHYYW